MAIVLGKHIFKTIFSEFNSSAPLISSTFSLNSKRFDSTYKAAVLSEFGTTIEIQEKKRKKLKKGDLRIKVHYAGVNLTDVIACAGELIDVKQKLPFVPGHEISGSVLEATPEAVQAGFHVGDKIVALNKTDFSAFAEECVISSTDCWLLPSTLNYKQGASFVDGYATALIALSRRGRIKENDKLLITCTAGGLGLAAVDIAANVYRAKVIGVCDTEDKANILRTKGAWAALANEKNHVADKVAEVTEKKGVRVVLDEVGGATTEALLKCVAYEGSFILAGTGVRRVPTISTALLLPNAVNLMAVSLTSYRSTASKVYRAIVQDAIDMYEQGLISPLIAQEFKLAEVNEALKFITDRKSTGKVVISIEN